METRYHCVPQASFYWCTLTFQQHSAFVLETRSHHLHQFNSRLNVVPAPFGLGRNGCWPAEGPSYPGHPLYFFAMLPPERPQKGSTQLSKIGRLFSLFLFLFSFPFLALLCLLILLLLLMSGNVHPNPGPIFPCSVCAGNVTWRGKSVQCCACSKWVHLRCSQLSLSKFRALGSSHSCSCPLCRNTVTPPPRTPPTRTPPLWNPAPLC